MYISLLYVIFLFTFSTYVIFLHSASHTQMTPELIPAQFSPAAL